MNLKDIFTQRRKQALLIKDRKIRNAELTKIAQIKKLCTVASELVYGDDVIFKIAKSNSVIQAENILKDARLAS